MSGKPGGISGKVVWEKITEEGQALFILMKVPKEDRYRKDHDIMEPNLIIIRGFRSFDFAGGVIFTSYCDSL